jgi:hypothetical protein
MILVGLPLALIGTPLVYLLGRRWLERRAARPRPPPAKRRQIPVMPALFGAIDGRANTEPAPGVCIPKPGETCERLTDASKSNEPGPHGR